MHNFNYKNSENHLFKAYPKLKEKISYINIGDYPAPILQCNKFESFLNHKNIYIKRDDLSGKLQQNGSRSYGGNKIRKLEFILADAIANNAKSILTMGSLGSNFALATAIYSKMLNLKCSLMLVEQPVNKFVQNNLLLDLYYGADLYFFPDRVSRNKAVQEFLQKNNAYFIPIGGSNSLGTIGFVNAAFELKEQIDQKKMKEPDLIYLAVGSCGTAAGLLLGLMDSNLKSKIIAVTVEPGQDDILLDDIKKLFYETNLLLNSLDSSFKIYDFPKDKLIINKSFCGEKYGQPTKEAIAAIELFKNIENIQLDPTYTSKALAAMINDIKSKKNAGESILFWNSYCEPNFENHFFNINFRNLPEEFHKFFE